MAETWANLYEASFGGVRIDVLSTEDTNGRVLATYSMPHRDGSPVRDMGAEPRVTRCKVLFFQLDDQDNPHERFARFKAIADRAEPATFVHPISGSYRARVGALNWSASPEQRNTIDADVTFHEDTDQPAAFQAGPGSTARVGAAEVEADAAEATQAISDYNDGLVDPDEDDEVDEVDDGLVSEARDLAARWESSGDTLSSREVELALGSASVRLQSEIDLLEAEDNLDLYDVLVALTKLHATLRRAAASVIEDSPRMFEVTLTSPAPLYAVVARVYGGAEAHARFDQALRLNDIPNPARIESGTRLRLQQPSTSARYGRAA